MAYVAGDMVYVRPYSSTIRLWKYTTTDSYATASGGGYFSSETTRLVPGDLLAIYAADATAIHVWVTIGQYGAPSPLIVI